jgi:hypothetical protein
VTKQNTSRIQRTGHLRWVTIADIVVNPDNQRQLRKAWADEIAANFNPDNFSPPLLSFRNGTYFVIDGQHRIEAMRINGWNERQVQCWVYEGLTEAQEAEFFLEHNHRKAVGAFDKFVISVHANRAEEADINRIVRSQGLKISSADGGVRAVGALRKVYSHGPDVLARSLRIVRDSYGDDGMQGHVIEGIGLLCARYNGTLDETKTIYKLQTARGGLGALTTKASLLRKAYGKSMPHCIAGAACELISSGRGGQRLPDWWKS